MARLPEGVYLRGKRLWIRFTPQQGGKQIRMPTGLSKDLPGAIGMAAALRAKMITEAFEGRWFPEKRGDCTLEAAVAEYLDSITKKRETPEIKKRLARAMKFFGASTLIGSITHKYIRSWQRELETEKIRGGRTRATTTVLHFLVNLRSAFRAAVEAKLTASDPMHRYRLPKPQNERSRIVSETELAMLISGALDQNDPDLADAIVLAHELGLRQEKVIGMRWERIDGRIYSVPPTPGGKPTPKRVPLSRLALRVLERRGRQDKGPIFVDVTANQISLRFGRLVRKLKIKDLHFHDLRHTAFTELERAGVSLRAIKEISGHHTITNLFRYQNLDDEDLTAAIDKRIDGRRLKSE